MEHGITESSINLLPWTIDDTEKTPKWYLDHSTNSKCTSIPPIYSHQFKFLKIGTVNSNAQLKIKANFPATSIALLKPQKVIIQESKRSFLQKPYKSNLLNHFHKGWRNTKKTQPELSSLIYESSPEYNLPSWTTTRDTFLNLLWIYSRKRSIMHIRFLQ